jgi:Flp pilus assembly protein TadD
LRYLEQAVKANPAAAVWEIETGNTLAAMGELAEAETHFRNAIQLDVTDWVSWRALALFSISRNYKVDTIGLEATRQALVFNPNSPPLLDLMGTGLMLQGDLDSAERFFLQADQLDPNQAAILIHLGQVNIYRGQKQSAFNYFRRAAEVAEESRLRELANRLLKENGGK